MQFNASLLALLLLLYGPLGVAKATGFNMPVMVVGGNFTLGGRPSNLAQYDPQLKLWVRRALCAGFAAHTPGSPRVQQRLFALRAPR